MKSEPDVGWMEGLGVAAFEERNFDLVLEACQSVGPDSPPGPELIAGAESYLAQATKCQSTFGAEMAHYLAGENEYAQAAYPSGGQALNRDQRLKAQFALLANDMVDQWARLSRRAGKSKRALKAIEASGGTLEFARICELMLDGEEDIDFDRLLALCPIAPAAKYLAALLVGGFGLQNVTLPESSADLIQVLIWRRNWRAIHLFMDDYVHGEALISDMAGFIATAQEAAGNDEERQCWVRCFKQAVLRKMAEDTLLARCPSTVN